MQITRGVIDCFTETGCVQRSFQDGLRHWSDTLVDNSFNGVVCIPVSLFCGLNGANASVERSQRTLSLR